MDRRLFLQHLLAMTAGLAAAPACASGEDAAGVGLDVPPGGLDPVGGPGGASSGDAVADDAVADGASSGKPLPERVLGATGVALPVLGLGGFHVSQTAKREGGRAGRATAAALVETALAEGVRFLDTAEQYHAGLSEEIYGDVLAGSGRDEVFLMTKTFALDTRSAESAKRHLEGSLKRLRTDHLDLWQLHSVRTPADVDKSFGDDGAMTYIRRMREEGVVRFVGVTGHQHPAANLRALNYFDEGLTFDTMQLPVNPIDAHQLSFQSLVVPQLVKRGIAVLAMKTSAAGALLSKGLTTIEDDLRYVLSLPVSVAIVGMEDENQVRRNATIVRELSVMDADEAEALLARIAPKADLSLEWYKSG